MPRKPNDTFDFYAFAEWWRKQFPRTPGTTIYAIQCGEDGPVKIGVAKKPWERLATLQTANPYRLRGLAAWPGSVDEEQALHQLFAAHRLEGEWFQASPGLIRLVEWFGFPTCDFAKPSNCACRDKPPTSYVVCKGCGVQFCVPDDGEAVA